MGDIKLLDCTLRDGGYVNDWNFGHNNLVSIFERLVDANVDFIEVGFWMGVDHLIWTEALCRIQIVLKKYMEILTRKIQLLLE